MQWQHRGKVKLYVAGGHFTQYCLIDHIPFQTSLSLRGPYAFKEGAQSFCNKEKANRWGFVYKLSYSISISYGWWMELSRSRKQECTLLTKVILTNANFAGYNWTEINALSVNSNLHAQDITSFQWYQFTVYYLNKRAMILYLIH